MKKAYKLHRWLGLLLGLPMLLWTLSGIAHPLMGHFFSPETAHRFLPSPSIPASHLQITPSQSSARLGSTPITAVGLAILDTEAYYRIQTDADPEPIYINARTGAVLEDGVHRHATELAKAFLGDPEAQVQQSETVRTFSTEYSRINRILPVQKVRFDRPDGIELFIDTEGARLAAVNDRLRIWNLRLFAFGHKWTFLGSEEAWTRLLIVATFSLLTFLIGLSGLWLYGLLWFRRGTAPSRGLRIHRWLGVAFSVALIGFAGSGFLVTLVKFGPTEEPRTLSNSEIPPQLLAKPLEKLLQVLGDQPIYAFNVIEMKGSAYFRVGIAGDLHTPGRIDYFPTDAVLGGPIPDGDRSYAAYLLTKAHPGNTPPEILNHHALLTRFDEDYGFLNRRLPVHRFGQTSAEHPDGLIYHIETSTATLSHLSTPQNRRQSAIFVNLHKFHFLNFMGNTTRDAILIVVMGLLLILSVTGVYSAFKPRKRKDA